MPGFDEALEIVFALEGGFVHDPDDRGGATKFGITQATYDAWRDGAAAKSVADITKEEAARIYRTRYWNAVGADTLEWPLSAVMFDMAVNHGPATAKRILQKALGVRADGMVGPTTRAVMQPMAADSLAEHVLWHRVERYREISKGSQLKFLRGWLYRVARLREETGLADPENIRLEYAD